LNIRRFQRWLPVVPAALLATAITGCAAADLSATPAPATSATTADAPADAPAATDATPAATKRPAKPVAVRTAPCGKAAVKATVALQPQRIHGDTLMAMLQLTNTSDASCTLTGWATVLLTNAADDAEDVPVRKVEQPGPSTTVKLGPGTTASAGIKWTRCDKADGDCPTGNFLRVLLPGGAEVETELEGFPAPEQNNLTMSELQIGTLQPSHQGVVAW
jgi:hypothetical protein